MYDGTIVTYTVDLIYTERGSIYPQGLTLITTDHEDVARKLSASTSYVALAKRLHGRRGNGYSLRVRKVCRTTETTRETIQ